MKSVIAMPSFGNVKRYNFEIGIIWIRCMSSRLTPCFAILKVFGKYRAF